MILVHNLDTEAVLDHYETDTEDIKILHVDKEILIAQDDHKTDDQMRLEGD